jgi:hypothetical protein
MVEKLMGAGPQSLSFSSSHFFSWLHLSSSIYSLLLSWKVKNSYDKIGFGDTST